MATPLPTARAASPPLERLLRNRETAFWVLQAFGWSAYFVAQYVSALFYPEKIGPAKLNSYACVLLVAAVSGCALSSLLRYAYRRLRDRPLTQVAPIAFVLIYAAALIWRLFINAGYVVFMDQHELFGSSATIFANALISTYLLMSWSALYFGLYFYESVQRERVATLRAMALAQEAQVKMLRYQLNPHFLFNTLNAISTLILDRDNDTANLAVTRLSAFLRHTLDQDPLKKVTLGQELEALELYLGIEKLRFGTRLRLVWEVDPAALAALVPSLLLQPLIENSLKYAIAPSESGGTLHIGARLIGARLLLHVADDGPGLADPALFADGHGVGLRNTRERLGALYGARARFVGVETAPGLRADIEIPAEFAS